MPTGSDGWRGERSDPSLEIPVELSDTGEFYIPPTLAEEPIGRIGRYDVLGRMAVGGMAEIFLAREDATAGASRYLVVKVVRPHLAGEEDFGEMFLNEGRLALRLKHPHICHVYEFGVDRGRYFIAMEYVHGATLRQALRRAALASRSLPVPVAVRIIAHVAEALSSAHKTRDEDGRGVVHRDVTPQNIMVGFDGVVKLLDFGIAQAQGDRTDADSGTFKGKVAYLAPEQCKGHPVDGRSDIFSLGVCLWEVLTARPLFRRKNEVDTLMAIVHEPAPDPRTLGIDVPAPLVAVLNKALAKSPTDRFQSAGEMERALQQYLMEQQQLVNTSRIARVMEELFAEEVRRGPLLDRGDEVVARLAPRVELDEGPSSAERPRKRGGSWVPALATGSLLLLGGAGWMLLQPERAISTRDEGRTGEVPPHTAQAPPEPAAETPVVEVAPATPIDPVAADAADAGLAEVDAGETVEGEERRRRRRLRTKRGFLVEPDF